MEIRDTPEVGVAHNTAPLTTAAHARTRLLCMPRQLCARVHRQDCFAVLVVATAVVRDGWPERADGGAALMGCH